MIEAINQTEKLVGVEVSGTTLRAVCLGAGADITETYQTPINKG